MVVVKQWMRGEINVCGNGKEVNCHRCRRGRDSFIDEDIHHRGITVVRDDGLFRHEMIKHTDEEMDSIRRAQERKILPPRQNTK